MTPTNPPSLNDAVREAVTMRPIPLEALQAGAKAAADVAIRRDRAQPKHEGRH